MKKHLWLSLIVKADIIIIGLCGLIMCAFWFPFSLSLTSFGLLDVDPTSGERLRFWSQLIFFWATAIPCFIILIIGWTISGAIKNNNVFTDAVLKKVRAQGIILLVDLMIFLAGNIFFACLRWNDFAIIYYIFTAIGLVAVSGLYVLAHYLKDSIELKKETEGLI